MCELHYTYIYYTHQHGPQVQCPWLWTHRKEGLTLRRYPWGNSARCFHLCRVFFDPWYLLRPINSFSSLVLFWNCAFSLLKDSTLQEYLLEMVQKWPTSQSTLASPVASSRAPSYSQVQILSNYTSNSKNL